MSVFNKFGKLLKYDFLESFYSIVLINAILLALMAFSKYMLWDLGNLSFAKLFLWFLSPLGILLSVIFLTITIIRLLYNRLFTSDGYLTFALPVRLDAILLSKIIVSSFYVILSSFVVCVWALFLAQDFGFSIGDMIFAFGESPLLMGLSICNSIVSIIAMSALVLLVLAILHIGAITRFKTLCGIMLFLFFLLIESAVYGLLVGDMLDNIGSGKFGGTLDSVLMNAWIAGLIFNALKCAIYYFATRYLIANKLEI